MFKNLIAILSVMLSVAGSGGIGQTLAGDWIVGSMSIRNDSGHNAYGEYLSVFLVSEKNPVSVKHCLGETNWSEKWTASTTATLIFTSISNRSSSTTATSSPRP